MANSKKKHIAEIYLDYVGISFSRKYFSEAVEENPFPNTFEGIRLILLKFNIRSKGVAFSQEEIVHIVDPFVTTLPSLFDGFVLVIQITDGNVTVLSEGGIPKTISTNDYFAAWDGNVLFPEVTEKSDEPDYRRNKIFSRVESLRIPLTLIAILLLIVITFKRNMPQVDILFPLVLIVVYCTGIVVSCLLLMESMNVYNPLIRKVCHVGNKINCSKVLESKQSKLLGLIGWSEIGLIYFTGSLLFLLTSPKYVNILLCVSLFALPYTVWSVMYQWTIVKKWCPLCLTVQTLLWGQFIVLAFNYTGFQLGDITISSVVIYSLCMIIPAIALWWIIPWISKANARDVYMKAWLKMKSEEDVFITLLSKSEECDLPESARQIVLGNKNASNTLTVISNPYCHHCASFHTRLVQFLYLQSDFKAEIVFVGESTEVIKKLISAYLINDSSTVESIYTEWFKDHDKIFEKHSLDSDLEVVATLYQSCRKWYEKHMEMGTPTIFINNRLLPNGYVLEDLNLLSCSS